MLSQKKNKFPKFSMGNKVTIGFSLSRGTGGPASFMKRLRLSIKKQNLANVSLCLNPFTDINIYANKVRNPWRKPYIFRVDGINFDKAITIEDKHRVNSDVFYGIDNANGLVFQSEFDKRLILRFYSLPKTPITIIPNGVDLNIFTSHGYNRRAMLEIGELETVFISSAKWRTHKRLNAVIEVFRRYKTNINGNCRLIVLGQTDGVHISDVKDVHFIGHVSHSDLPSWYRTADACLFFSWLDHCPNTVVEAIACGLPVVCTNQGGTREIVERTNGGIVVEADDAFNFDSVCLYKPPMPNLDALLKATITVVEERERIVNRIDLSQIDIIEISRQYYNFLKSICEGKQYAQTA